MEKETVILRLRVSIDIGQDAITWMNSVTNFDKQNDNVFWFAKDGGKIFLSIFQNSWQQALVEETDQTIQIYLLELGFNEKLLPKTKITEAFSSSWEMYAEVTILASVRVTFALIKDVSEIPDMVEGLTKLKDSIADKFFRRADIKAAELLKELAKINQLPPPPANILEMVDFVLDARPILLLKPSEMKADSLYFQAAVSQDDKSNSKLIESELSDINTVMRFQFDKGVTWFTFFCTLNITLIIGVFFSLLNDKKFLELLDKNMIIFYGLITISSIVVMLSCCHGIKLTESARKGFKKMNIRTKYLVSCINQKNNTNIESTLYHRIYMKSFVHMKRAMYFLILIWILIIIFLGILMLLSLLKGHF